jgi:hypothetical protein
LTKKAQRQGTTHDINGNPEMTLLTRFIPIANMEDELKFDSSLIQTMAKIVDVLPSLEV